MAVLTRTRVAQEEIDRLSQLVKDGDVALRELKAKYDALVTECQDAMRGRLAATEQITKLLAELKSESTASIKLRDALATFMSNVDADVKILMAAIK